MDNSGGLPYLKIYQKIDYKENKYTALLQLPTIRIPEKYKHLLVIFAGDSNGERTYLRFWNDPKNTIKLLQERREGDNIINLDYYIGIDLKKRSNKKPITEKTILKLLQSRSDDVLPYLYDPPEPERPKYYTSSATILVDLVEKAKILDILGKVVQAPYEEISDSYGNRVLWEIAKVLNLEENK